MLTPNPLQSAPVYPNLPQTNYNLPQSTLLVCAEAARHYLHTVPCKPCKTECTSKVDWDKSYQHQQFCRNVVQEGERVMDTFQKQLHLPVTRIDDSKRMLAALKVHAQPLGHVCHVYTLGKYTGMHQAGVVCCGHCPIRHVAERWLRTVSGVLLHYIIIYNIICYYIIIISCIQRSSPLQHDTGQQQPAPTGSLATAAY